ncbi:unannotated protein [freshwater metagenome]|uniref:Unannotated protein n=1 Tax=freshwater metagenome TaxID=449393 RepID=A0A6J6ACZ5_9ZZZZ
MYSLALLVVILMSILIFSGPLAFLLTTQWVKNLNKNTPYLVIRRIVLGILGAVGLFISIVIVIQQVPISIRIISLLSIAIHLKSLDREYGFITRFIRRDSHGPQGQQ